MPPQRRRKMQPYQYKDPNRTPDPCEHLAQEITALRMAITLARNELKKGHHSIALAILVDADAPSVPSRKPRSPFQ